MSLFGTASSEDAPPTSPVLRSRNELFENEPNSRSGHDSLFDDESPSPWDIPTRKLRTRTELLRTLLSSTDVPGTYISSFESITRDDGAGRTFASAGDLSRILAASKLGADDQAKIMAIITPDASDNIALNQDEFNVFLALIGLAQEGEIVGLDGVDERRNNLPHINLPGLVAATSTNSTNNAKAPNDFNDNPSIPPPTTPPLPATKVSMTYTPDDPWNTPEIHKNHRHTDAASNGRSLSKSTNELGSGTSEAASMRTTSNFTTPEIPAIGVEEDGHQQSTIANVEEQDPGLGWDVYGRVGNAAVSSSLFVGAGTTNNGSDDNIDSAHLPAVQQTSRTIGSGRTGTAVEENIVVSLLPEKEGLFMFQHHNYEVTSTRRGSKVVRRYSDFVWLLECLHKRYPFRVLPLLPPKRVAVNGNHLSNDGAFIEKRRRGLGRFLNALTRHPILSAEQLVVMFLTVPTELSVWRKQATISVQDEFSGRPLPPGLEESLSPQLEALFDQTRAGVRRSTDLYITVCNIMDRLVKRSEGVANDHARLAVSLQSITEANLDTYATDTNDVPLLNDGLVAMGKRLRTGQTLMEDEAKAWDEGVLEDLKRQRDALVGLRDLFDRKDRLDRDNIPYLERRIQSNETKLASLHAKASEQQVKSGEIEKVEDNIIKDKEAIIKQHNRSIFVKECIRDELVYFQSTQYHVSRWNQDWAQERVKYSEMLADNWRRLLDELDGMPLGD